MSEVKEHRLDNPTELTNKEPPEKVFFLLIIAITLLISFHFLNADIV
jgi:hypothetical protein